MFMFSSVLYNLVLKYFHYSGTRRVEPKRIGQLDVTHYSAGKRKTHFLNCALKAKASVVKYAWSTQGSSESWIYPVSTPHFFLSHRTLALFQAQSTQPKEHVPSLPVALCGLLIELWSMKCKFKVWE